MEIYLVKEQNTIGLVRNYIACDNNLDLLGKYVVDEAKSRAFINIS